MLKEIFKNLKNKSKNNKENIKENINNKIKKIKNVYNEIKINDEVNNEMKAIKERLDNLEREVVLKKKRISDISIIEIQEVMNNLKTLIDNEVIRRAENLNKQVMK
jgi:hypothetical protein